MEIVHLFETTIAMRERGPVVKFLVLPKNTITTENFL